MKGNAELGMRNAEGAAAGGGLVGLLTAFPLTPALSLREREPPRQSLAQAERSKLAERRDQFLPLPEGEGRGEGEGDSYSPRRSRHLFNLSNEMTKWARVEPRPPILDLLQPNRALSRALATDERRMA
jgi:hypothetical protein